MFLEGNGVTEAYLFLLDLSMKAVILAGGRGTRLKPLTDTIPKPMAMVSGRPILEYTFSILPKDISEIIVVTGWMGHKIKEHFGHKFNGRKIFYVQQEKPLGTFNALFTVKKFIEKEERFMIISGDDLYGSDDLKKICSSKDLSILTTRTDEPEKFGICAIDNNGHLKEIVEKPEIFCGDLANIGVYKLDSDIFNENIVYGKNGEHYLAPMIGSLARKKKIEVVKASFWHPIADLNDLQKAQELI